jgi:hypothetical protein
MFNPTVSPHDLDTALVSCDMTGSYITHDGGRSWRMFNLGSATRFFVFDPADSRTIYAQAAGLWRSRDSGNHWDLVYPKRAAIEAVQMSSDHAEETIVAAPDALGFIAALAIDPSDSRTLYAAAVKSSDAALFISHDAGESWAWDAKLRERPLHVWVKLGTVYVAEPHFLEIRSKTGWKRWPTPLEFTDIAAAPPTFYGIAQDSVFVSRDAASWVNCAPVGREVQAIATSFKHPEVAYVSYAGGIARTSDFGAHWQAPGAIHDAWITPALGEDWGGVALALGVAEQNPAVAYATDLGRTLKTVDGGTTWNAVYSRRIEGAGWTSTGLDVTTSYGFHFDPFDPQRQFITYTDIGLFRSEDGGASWTSSTRGVPREWRNTTYWIAFDPLVRGRVWSVNSGTHDLPRPRCGDMVRC